MIPWINIELTNRCNKSCSFCGRAKSRKDSTMELGDMDIALFRQILNQYEGQIIQFNKDGEPLLYPDLWEVGYLCRQSGQITNIVTNGILLWEKRKELLEFNTVCVSVIEDDPAQFENVKKFIEYCNTPVVIKFLGEYSNPEYDNLDVKITRRRLHNPQSDTDYHRDDSPLIPEIGICLDFLLKPSIDWQGNMYICNRFDPEGKGIIGSVRHNTPKEVWEGHLRQIYMSFHLTGQRDKVPLCTGCQYWGCPKE